MIRKQLLRERFAARENQPARITASVGNAQELEQTYHVLIEQHVAVKLLEQVEHNVWLEFLDGVADRKEFVLDAQWARFVAELPETLDDVEFGFEGECLLRREPFQRIRRNVVGVNEHENAQLFHSAIQSRCPSL